MSKTIALFGLGSLVSAHVAGAMKIAEDNKRREQIKNIAIAQALAEKQTLTTEDFNIARTGRPMRKGKGERARARSKWRGRG